MHMPSSISKLLAQLRFFVNEFINSSITASQCTLV